MLDPGPVGKNKARISPEDIIRVIEISSLTHRISKDSNTGKITDLPGRVQGGRAMIRGFIEGNGRYPAGDPALIDWPGALDMLGIDDLSLTQVYKLALNNFVQTSVKVKRRNI
jgi:hypothetical protein